MLLITCQWNKNCYNVTSYVQHWFNGMHRQGELGFPPRMRHSQEGSTNTNNNVGILTLLQSICTGDLRTSERLSRQFFLPQLPPKNGIKSCACIIHIILLQVTMTSCICTLFWYCKIYLFLTTYLTCALNELKQFLY